VDPDTTSEYIQVLRY